MQRNGSSALRAGATFLLGTALMTSMPLDNGDAVAANPIRAAEPWHLRNPHPHAGPHRLHVDMNVAPLAGTVQGRECRVAVVEPLQPTTRIHAHMVSSMVDGRRRPDVPGGVGVAPAARPRIYDLNTILEDTDLSAYTAVNMSYASTRPYSSDTRTIRMVHGLMKNGRNGLGSLLFSAAGNDRRGYYEPDKIQPQVTLWGRSIAMASSRPAVPAPRMSLLSRRVRPSPCMNGDPFAGHHSPRRWAPGSGATCWRLIPI